MHHTTPHLIAEWYYILFRPDSLSLSLSFASFLLRFFFFAFFLCLFVFAVRYHISILYGAFIWNVTLLVFHPYLPFNSENCIVFSISIGSTSVVLHSSIILCYFIRFQFWTIEFSIQLTLTLTLVQDSEASVESRILSHLAMLLDVFVYFVLLGGNEIKLMRAMYFTVQISDIHNTHVYKLKMGFQWNPEYTQATQLHHHKNQFHVSFSAFNIFLLHFAVHRLSLSFSFLTKILKLMKATTDSVSARKHIFHSY